MKVISDMQPITDGIFFATRYFNSIKESETERARIHRDYRGEALKQQLSANPPPDKQKAIDNLRLCKKNMLAQIEAHEARLWNPENISPDYRFLQLPVVLSTDEIRMLHRRNVNDPLYCRALQKYCKDHGIDSLVELIDLSDNISYRRKIVEQYFNDLEEFVENGNSFTLSLYDNDFTAGITEKLSDNYHPAYETEITKRFNIAPEEPAAEGEGGEQDADSDKSDPGEMP